MACRSIAALCDATVHVDMGGKKHRNTLDTELYDSGALLLPIVAVAHVGVCQLLDIRSE